MTCYRLAWIESQSVSRTQWPEELLAHRHSDGGSRLLACDRRSEEVRQKIPGQCVSGEFLRFGFAWQIDTARLIAVYDSHFSGRR